MEINNFTFNFRAQNESDLRRTRTENKKLQEALSHQKRHSTSGATPTSPTSSAPPPKRPNRTGGVGSSATSSDEIHGQVTTTTIHQLNLDILKLNQELSAMRETNKFLEEKIQVSWWCCATSGRDVVCKLRCCIRGDVMHAWKRLPTVRVKFFFYIF